MSIESVARLEYGWYCIELTLRNGTVVTLSHPRWGVLMKRARDIQALDRAASRDVQDQETTP